MTTDLRDQLEDLLVEVPHHLAPDAGAAWAAGARRRTTQRVAVLATVLVVLVLTAGVATRLPGTRVPEPAGGSSGVDGHPARVTQPWDVRGLPDTPGPMAMVFQQSDGSWWAADAVGHAWPMPQEDMIDSYPPALSPDGRTVGYLADRRSYVVEDLVTGKRTTIGGIGDGGEDLPAPQWFLASQAPSFWSPDGRRLLLKAGGLGPGSEDTTALVLMTSRSWVETDQRGYPAGWLDDDTTAWVVPAGQGHHVRVVGVRPGGRVVSSVPLDLGASRASDLNQWSASVSPDGTRIAVVDGAGSVRLYRLSDGRLLRRAPVVASDTCAVSWDRERPVVYASDRLQTLDGTALTTFGVGDETVCAMASTDALAGASRPGIGWWGQLAGWVRLHPSAVAGGLLLAAGALGLVVVRLRRRRLTPTS